MPSLDVPMIEPRPPLDQINDQIAAVLDPLAEDCRGLPPDTIRPIVRGAWRRAFHGDLSESAAADLATAIHDGRPWPEALWVDGW
jgi:hypothetical protein